MDSERLEEVAQDIGETAEALNRLLGEQLEAEQVPGGVPNSPELPGGNGEAAGQPTPSPQPAKEPELVPVGEGSSSAGEQEANYPESGRLPDNLTRKAKNGTTQYPKNGPSAQEHGAVGCLECGGECQGHAVDPEGLTGGQDHPGELVALEPPVWGTVERASDGMVAGGPPPAGPENQPGTAELAPALWGSTDLAGGEPEDPPPGDQPGKGLQTIYDFTDEDLVKMGTDKLLELAGITTVDLTDAKDYEAIRGAKLVAVEKLQRALAESHTRDPELLAKISQKLGQLEKAKMEVIQLKLGGKPGDRTKPGTKLRARIGIASSGADGRSVVELEVEGK